MAIPAILHVVIYPSSLMEISFGPSPSLRNQTCDTKRLMGKQYWVPGNLDRMRLSTETPVP